MKKGLRWQIKSGNDVKFWTDKWVPSLNNFQIQSSRQTEEEQVSVASFIDSSTKEWNVHKLKQSVSEQEVKAIIPIPISKLGGTDRLIWHYAKNGRYSVKSGYHVARAIGPASNTSNPSSSFIPPPSFWKFVWNLNIPPKVKHFWWRACRNALATKENLHKRKCARNPICPLCCNSVESIEQLLF